MKLAIRVTYIICACASALLVACAADKTAPATSPAAPAAERGNAAAATDYARQPAGVPAAQPGYPASPSSPQTAPQTTIETLVGPWEELEGARLMLEASNDCYSACRALRSMDRAAGHVCDLQKSGSRCEDAKTAVVRARTKVKATCRTCPDGTTTDETAPIPAPQP